MERQTARDRHRVKEGDTERETDRARDRDGQSERQKRTE